MTAVLATPADVAHFATSLDSVARAADDLARTLREQGQGDRVEGAVELREIAGHLAAKVRSGEFGGQTSSLPLSRPFGEWSYGELAEPAWKSIDEAQRVWDERLGGGDFALRDE